MGDLDLRFYLSILWRRSPYVLAITVVASVIAVVVALAMPKVYRASARILVEAPQIPANLARSTVVTDALDQLQIVREQATTSDNLVALATKLNIYGDEGAKLSKEDIARDMRGRMFLDEIVLNPSQAATVLDVGFEANDRVQAADGANEIAAFILSKNALQRTARAGETMRFFELEVDKLKSELSGIEAEILKFKNENKDTLPDNLEFRRSQQLSQQQGLQMLEREDAELRSRRNTLVQVYETTGQVAKSGPLTLEQQQLMDLNRALSDQLSIFSEESPTIKALRKRIAALQTGLRDTETADTGNDGRKATSELDLQLSDIDERLEFIAQAKTKAGRDIADLGRTIAATPGKATFLNALERNRENVQAQYNAAVARLAEASTGEQIEVLSKGVRFSIMESARPPEDAIRPSRRLVASLGVAGGIGMGLGLIVLLEFLNKTVRRPTELVQKLQIQPLATIPFIAAPIDLHPERRMVNAFTVSAAIAATLLLLSAIYLRSSSEILTHLPAFLGG